VTDRLAELVDAHTATLSGERVVLTLVVVRHDLRQGVGVALVRHRRYRLGGGGGLGREQPGRQHEAETGGKRAARGTAEPGDGVHEGDVAGEERGERDGEVGAVRDGQRRPPAAHTRDG